MALNHLGLGIAFLTLTVIILISGTDEMYPDFTCHPDFDHSTDDKYHGAGLILNSMEHCKNWDWKDHNRHWSCPKACFIMELGVTNASSMEFEELEYIKLMMQNYFKGTDDTASRVAGRIFLECSDEMKAVSSKHCDEWGGLYTCMENAWGCVD